MYQRSTVTMNIRELDRLKVIQAVAAGELRGVSPRSDWACARGKCDALRTGTASKVLSD
jgi:hypothetical protein